MVDSSGAGHAGLSGWAGAESAVSQVVLEQSQRCIQSYQANPSLIEEHANIERSVTEGGYGHRQLFELIQNGADEMQGASDGRIHVVLTPNTLYCANRGRPVTPQGAETILASHLSRKRGAEIGRFGLGFKSVLSISDRPQFFSHSGSFGWSAEESRVRIRERVPGEGPTPVLRLAHLLDAQRERDSDETLDELMSWATTVVKLPLTGEEHSIRLATDLRKFPAVFVVFSPHAAHVTLEERREEVWYKEITIRGNSNRRWLHVVENGRDGTPEEWAIFETRYHPSDDAWKDAGEYRNRLEVPLAWAVPVTGKQEIGEFWAFFPTTYKTTLRGVLNAPWKTNEDRQHLLQNNAFNTALIEQAARLIVSALPALSTPDDPAHPLSLITARGREPRNWADDMLTERVYDEAARSPSLPDQTGCYRNPDELKIHPRAPRATDDRWKAWVERWAGYPGRPIDWCHHSVEETTPRSRADRIMELAGSRPSSLREWLEALVSDGTAEASAIALSIVAEMVDEAHPFASEAVEAAVLRTSNGRLVPPQGKSVFRRTSMDLSTEETVYVDPELENDPATSRFLDILGIREADAFGRLAAAVEEGFASYSDRDWERFWLLARQTGATRAVEHLTRRGVKPNLRVRTRKGCYKPLEECLLPGAVIPSGSPDDEDFVVDDDFHLGDVEMLHSLGMSDGPRLDMDPRSAPWFEDYRSRMIDRYYAVLPPGARRPQQGKIVVDGAEPAGPLGLLRDLTPSARSRFIQNIPVEGLVTEWTVHAQTRPDDLPLSVPSPLVWVLEQTGRLATSMGLRPVRECVGPGLAEYSRVLPVADLDPKLTRALRLPDTLEAIKGSLWLSLLKEADESESHVELGMLYAVAATQLSAPSTIRCRRGEDWVSCPPSDAVATSYPDQYRRLQVNDVPVILVPDTDDAARLISEWGMKAFDEVYVTELRATSQGRPTPLEDVFPQLKFEPRRPLRGLFLARCDALEQLVRTPAGQTSEPIDIARRDETVYWHDRGDDLALLRELNPLLKLGLSEERCREVLRHREDVQRDRQIVRVRELPDVCDKLVAMLGGDALRERLPFGLVDAVEAEEGPVDDQTIAGLALAVYGPGVLREFRQELEDRGFPVPTQLAGSHQAKAFVSDLGFPAEYAGFRQPGLEPVLTVHGPVDFPPLHEYQELMVGRILEVLQSRPAQRGMLSLPTGAGKTRVAVDAVIRRLRSLPPDATSTPILWVAQTEELCEQAVQTWQLVWRNTGPARRLTISRLWNVNEADPVEDGYHLVITTDAKLERVIEAESYAWLREAQAVVIDEAHASISPRYTRVLAALGLTPHRSRCPLIGLSATPFRGTSTEETDRLAARYGRNRLDHHRDGRGILGENPYRHLQELGVLAEVRHEELPGVTLDLNRRERDALEQMRRLPASAEERLGHDTVRNRILVDKIQALPDDWPVLLFAASVNHAQTMAALLTRRGISAAAVSSDSDLGQRRHAIEQFRQGKTRVLANYGVLSQGFDAPATRAVIVARPTYSPNVYQQMIGRGLRGPRNGGKEECLIVNVADNIAQYGEELAFRQFEYLWKNR
ncbi:DEAD/DEAH box helicase family protein [Sphaerisporangium sp. TRM90804]|uniref:DEAD/DEAH box helicase n=1 Tax=Sphaerisporangium sp. TRM90804 TaxID=3031113 RepID=UPI002449DEA2|nr:DEAD/DEAH box helicase family protein [Sphaerisporangium sp. TRM90804]MDH2430318.1 DEAD/DEAH box helicase family protein [Sphaerisporangium sp. TRM90804]